MRWQRKPLTCPPIRRHVAKPRKPKRDKISIRQRSREHTGAGVIVHSFRAILCGLHRTLKLTSAKVANQRKTEEK